MRLSFNPPSPSYCNAPCGHGPIVAQESGAVEPNLPNGQKRKLVLGGKGREPRNAQAGTGAAIGAVALPQFAATRTARVSRGDLLSPVSATAIVRSSLS